MTPETVCAVVVTYNRRELLIECLIDGWRGNFNNLNSQKILYS